MPPDVAIVVDDPDDVPEFVTGVVVVELCDATVVVGPFTVVVADVVDGDELALVLIVTEEETMAEVGPVFDEASRTEFAPRRRMTVPSVVQVAVTDTDVPADPLTDIVHDAEPVLEKSLPAIPETDSSNETAKTSVRETDGELGAAIEADGEVVSAASVVNRTPPDAVGS